MSVILKWTAIIGAVAAALALGGYALRDGLPRAVVPTPPETAETPAPPPPHETPSPPPGAAPAAAQQDDAPEPAPDAADPPPVSPRFDVVRVTIDGGALVAGSAAPGAQVFLRIDGELVAETVADAGGQFVMMFTLDPSDDPQTMALESRGATGEAASGSDTVVLSPRPAIALAVDEPASDTARAEDTPTETLAASLRESPPASPPADGGPDLTPDAASSAGQTAAAEHEAAPPPEVAMPRTAGQEPAGADGELPETASLARPQPALLQAPQPPQAPQAGGGDAPALAPPERGPVGAPPVTQPDALAAAPTDALPGFAADGAPPLTPAPALPAPAAQSAREQTALLPPAFVLRASGAVEVGDRAPQPADAVVIDAISYSDSGGVQISGRAGQDDPEARVQLYLDNRPLALAQAERGTWTVAVPELAPGLYTLRADQLAEDGRVATRFETPFQRAAPEDVARPPARPGREREARAQLVTVQPGNSLWRISRERYGKGVRYVQIYRANQDQIRDPDLIYPGQIFVIPD